MEEQHKRIAAQKVDRKTRLAAHKATAMRAAATLEEINSKTPSEPTKLPTKAELAEMTGTESDETDGIASAVMDPSKSHEDADPVDDGFAALRAQRAQRKKLMREHKRTSAGVSIECRRATTGKYDRKKISGNGVDTPQGGQ